ADRVFGSVAAWHCSGEFTSPNGGIRTLARSGRTYKIVAASLPCQMAASSRLYAKPRHHPVFGLGPVKGCRPHQQRSAPATILAEVKIVAGGQRYIFAPLFSASCGSLAQHHYFSLFFYRLTLKMAVWQ
ncbi:MAG: hypothetical protein ACRD2O_01750, partial [Terriglobia bacterium]